MKCPTVDEKSPELLLNGAAGTLRAEDRLEWDRHVAECNVCMTELAAQHTLWVELGRWEAPPVSPYFDRKLLARIESEAAQGRSRWSWLQLGWMKAIPVAVVAMAIMLGFFHDYRAVQQHAPHVSGQTAILSAADAEQVEGAVDDLQLLGQIDTQPDTARRDSI